MYLNQEYKNSFRILKGGLISLVISSSLYGSPNGGIVTSGNANISQNGNTTNINQSSNKATINWQNFNIKSNETVNFNQPNSNSITLNRVKGNEKSIIDGALNANGQVWILNSNGTLFGKNAKVNTSGLLVTTKNLNDEDFQKGNYNFKGDSKASIENLGNISSEKYSSFIANSVVNNGTIKVHSGTINLTGASEFSISLDENSNISLKVTKGVLDALVENNNLLIANGGNVYLTTNAKNELLKGVVNNSGIIEANSLDDITGKQSEVIIFAHGGTANIDGEIKAKNSFVETSGENLNVSANTKVIAKTWLLDPVNMTIESTGGNSLTGASVSAIAIQNALGGTNVELQADNNITVNQNITWSTDKQLKLTADSINVNATINNTNKTNGGVYFNAANNQSKVVFGADGKVIVNNVYQLQWINTALGGKYELGSNIDAGVTSSWNNGAGFNPISIFTGTFDGKGFSISDLYINRNMDFVGLFGYTSASTIKNIGLVNVNIAGSQNVGGLVGRNGNNSQIENSYVTGNVSGGNYSYNIGGLVGDNYNSQIKNSYFTGSVTGSQNVGGLVGDNYNSQIENSYALGSVSGYWYVGGLVGWNDNYSKIENSYVNGNVNGNESVGGLVGLNYNNSQIKNSYVSGNVNGNGSVGGLIGWNEGTITNSWYDNETNSGSMDDSGYGVLKNNITTALKNASSEWETDSSKGRGYGIDGTTALPFLKNVTKLSNTLFQDGLGTSAKPYTITNWTQLQNINNSNILTKNYYFNLLNDLSNQTSDYTNLASSTANGGLGWDSIGYNSSNAFSGVFDGKGFTISNLYINRPNQDYIGLFGITNSGIKNLGLVDVDITGKHQVGGLVGYYSYGETIENSYLTGTVTGNTNIGGLVGFNGGGTIINSYFSGNVTGSSQVGGLTGLHQGGTIENSYAIGEVRGNDYIGGLVGRHYLGTVKNSYASGLVSGNSNIGGLIGYSDNGTIQNSFYDKTKNTSNAMIDSATYGKAKAEILTAFSGQTGWGSGRGESVEGYEVALLPYLVGITREEDISKTILFNSGYGTSLNPYTITNWTQLQNINNPNILTENKYFNLINNLSSSTSDYTNLASSIANTGNGWKPIGDNFLDRFTGTFDGLGNTISDLYINRSSTNNVGLFGYTIRATIRNLGLVDVAITGNNYVGGLIGYNYNNSKIENSYASATVTRLSGTNTKFGGLVGYNNYAQITNSFYDKTKNPDFDNGLGIGKTTQEMSYGGTFKNASWDIIADSSVTSFTPIRKWDSVNNKYIWAISPLALNYNLGSKSTTYNGSVQNLSDFYSSVIVIPSGYEFLNIDYKFQKDGNDITGYKNAETYSNIKVALNGTSATDEFLTLATTGNLNGNLTINKANAIITANSMNKVYNGQTQSLSGYSVIGLVGGDRISDLAGISGDSVSGINVGEYNTNLSGSDNNYNLTFINGKLAILAQNNPTPVKQKIDNNVQKVIARINPSIFSNQFLSQTTQNSLNSNIRTPSFNNIGKTKIINGGIKIPENTATRLIDLESWEK